MQAALKYIDGYKSYLVIGGLLILNVATQADPVSAEALQEDLILALIASFRSAVAKLQI